MRAAVMDRADLGAAFEPGNVHLTRHTGVEFCQDPVDPDERCAEGTNDAEVLDTRRGQLAP